MEGKEKEKRGNSVTNQKGPHHLPRVTHVGRGVLRQFSPEVYSPEPENHVYTFVVREIIHVKSELLRFLKYGFPR